MNETHPGEAQEIADRIGVRLAEAREASKQSRKAVAAELKVTAAVVDKIEDGQWAELGPPVYARGYLRAYARLLEVEGDEADEYFNAIAPPPEPVMSERPRRARSLSQPLARYTSYIVATALIAIPLGVALIYAFRSPDEVRSSLTPSAQQVGAVASSMTPVANGALTRPQSAIDDVDSQTFASGFEAPVTSSPVPVDVAEADRRPSSRMPVENRQTEAGSNTSVGVGPLLVVDLTAEAWIDVRSEKGDRLEYGLMPAGSHFEFPVDNGLVATLGNASALSARLDGAPLDLSRHTVGDVVNLTISAAGGELSTAN